MIKEFAKASDRRLSPRVEIDIAAELASGSTLVPVNIHDLSSTGCGIEILTQDPDLATRIGSAGLLHLNRTDKPMAGAIISVTLRNMRFEGNILRYGLEFRPLKDDQIRQLAALMEAAGSDGKAAMSAATAADRAS